MISAQRVESAGAVVRERMDVSRQSVGILLLRVSTPTQSRTLRVLKVD